MAEKDDYRCEKIPNFKMNLIKNGHEILHTEREDKVFNYKHSILIDGKWVDVTRSTRMDGRECHLCGGFIKPELINENTIEFIPVTTSHYKFVPLENKQCRGAELYNSGKLTSEINVPTGKIIFINYFDKDENYTFPKDVKYKSENSINHIVGEYNLMQYFASRNIGYGQMGNMGVKAWIHKDGSIIINHMWVDEYDSHMEPGQETYYSHCTDHNISYEEACKLYGELKKIHQDCIPAHDIDGKTDGYISCEVWRWMCADIKFFEEYGETFKDKDHDICEVEPGRYRIEHYYGINKLSPVYSKLYKIGELV